MALQSIGLARPALLKSLGPAPSWTVGGPDSFGGLSGTFISSGSSDLTSVTFKPSTGSGLPDGEVTGGATWIAPSRGGLQRGEFRAIPTNPMIGPALALRAEGQEPFGYWVVGYRRDDAGSIIGLRLADASNQAKVIELNKL